jgi:hypothetical protein
MKIEQQVDPVDEQAKAKAALTELFTEARNGRHMWWSGSSPISMGLSDLSASQAGKGRKPENARCRKLSAR